MDSNISKSLVADYDSSSEEDNSLCVTKNPVNQNEHLTPATEMLDHAAKVISHSVFTNPYKEVENYELSVLEKHVKMTTVKELDAVQVKPCYKFYKGKCKLGDKCGYSHCNPVYNSASQSNDNNDDKFEDSKIISKKRCGLKDDLIPPKKYMKTYNKIK